DLIDANSCAFPKTRHKLIVTEKPSVAAVLAKVVGADTKEDGFFSGNGYLVSWCLGHLVELAAPDAYNPDYSKWALGDLPIIPDEWQTVVKPETKKQFNVLTGLLYRADVEEVVEATDVGQYQGVTN
ncbi:MAG: toprim domain-containing protein, partial [Ethanoligenens sp.]